MPRYVKSRPADLEREGHRLQTWDGPVRIVAFGKRQIQQHLTTLGYTFTPSGVVACPDCQAQWRLRVFTVTTLRFVAEHRATHQKAPRP